MKNISKYQLATAIAILFHIIGIIGFLFFPSVTFIKTTPLNLLLMCGLLFYTQEKKNRHFYIFFGLCVVTGIAVEILGTSTGLLFGNYSYGTVLGPGIYNVPYIIGVNWFIIIYCCAVSINTLLRHLTARLAEQTGKPSKAIQVLSVMVDGATIAVFFDWLMEPVAVKLGYWQWLGSGEIPLYNYLCWFIISMVLLLVFQKLQFARQNKFAVNLLLIQSMFFLLLRTFL
ncbi:MAG: carotenoid biosynthesis protein [Gloeobacteraceae cyanobacterium ES-bin-316]|nr:carotenoid biosynthesis protein [Ferruginibacter sp.]